MVVGQARPNASWDDLLEAELSDLDKCDPRHEENVKALIQ
jgi:hypothetical protein